MIGAFSCHCPAARALRGDREELRLDLGVSLGCTSAGSLLLGGPDVSALASSGVVASAEADTLGLALPKGSAHNRRIPFLACSCLSRKLVCLCAAPLDDLGVLRAFGEAWLGSWLC